MSESVKKLAVRLNREAGESPAQRTFTVFGDKKGDMPLEIFREGVFCGGTMSQETCRMLFVICLGSGMILHVRRHVGPMGLRVFL